jgi:hypothetical protein
VLEKLVNHYFNSSMWIRWRNTLMHITITKVSTSSSLCPFFFLLHWRHYLSVVVFYTEFGLNFSFSHTMYPCMEMYLRQITLLWSSKPRVCKIKLTPFNKHLILGQIIIKFLPCKELNICCIPKYDNKIWQILFFTKSTILNYNNKKNYKKNYINFILMNKKFKNSQSIIPMVL